MNKLDLTKERLAEMQGVLKSFENQILEGNINPLEWLLVQRAFGKWLNYAKEHKDINEACYKEVLRSNGYYKNMRITHTEGRLLKYDYSECDDARLETINKNIEYYTEQKKAIEAELQSLIKQDDFINNDTGEIISVKKPIPIYSKSFFTVKSK